MPERRPRSIGIRELKLRATQIARSVREDGQPYILTNRGRAFGVIRPLPADWEDRAREQALEAAPAGDSRLRAGRAGRPVIDGVAIARAVAKDLKRLYGKRLRRVVLFGSWARGEAGPESDIDLLVVLSRLRSEWEEHRRMDDVLWRHSFENNTVVTAFPVTEANLRSPSSPFLIRALTEGRDLA